MIALARGILLKPSGKMKWTANCVVLGPTPQASEDIGLVAFDADTEFDAARFAAQQIAKAKFGKYGEAGFVHPHKPPVYLATIGEFEGYSAMRGVSLSILIREYRGAQ
jgi:hypothetical protein